MTMPRPRSLIVLALTATVAVSGCTGDSEDSEQSPSEVLAQAKTNLDETAGVHIVLSTDELPKGVNGILSADGIGTHAPAFEGDLKVSASSVTADVEVVAVDDVVYAKLPFTTSFVEIDPADYGAPDPAAMMGTEEGLSAILTESEDVEEGEPVRDGETVLTEYTGKVPGDVVSAIIPSAAADASFEAKFTVTEDDLLNQAVLSGPFYPDAGDVTYTIDFDEYDTEKEITAP